ncbi:MAG TPA: hypothetical protein VFU36_00815 [Jatrophihabitans sp.]|nr:hypothetical protein [Jatrophihabitans sp.]
MMWDYGEHMSGWGWALTGFGMLLFWGLVITAVIVAVQYFRNPPPRPTDQAEPSPADILARRFARGEISEEEFLNRTRLLQERVPQQH